jgi:hypothetical protein
MIDRQPPIRDPEVARALNTAIEKLREADNEPNNEYGQSAPAGCPAITKEKKTIWTATKRRTSRWISSAKAMWARVDGGDPDEFDLLSFFYGSRGAGGLSRLCRTAGISRSPFSIA